MGTPSGSRAEHLMVITPWTSGLALMGSSIGQLAWKIVRWAVSLARFTPPAKCNLADLNSGAASGTLCNGAPDIEFFASIPSFIKAARASLGETDELCVCSRRQRRRRRWRRPKPYPGRRKWLQLGGSVPGTSRRQADVWGHRHTSELILLSVRARTILTVEIYKSCVRLSMCTEHRALESTAAGMCICSIALRSWVRINR